VFYKKTVKKEAFGTPEDSAFSESSSSEEISRAVTPEERQPQQFKDMLRQR